MFKKFFNSTFWKYHLSIFSLFVLGNLSKYLEMLQIQNVNYSMVLYHFGTYILKIYIPIFILFTLIYLIIYSSERLKLHIYYHIYIKNIYKRIFNVIINNYYISLIIESISPPKNISEKYHVWIQQMSYSNNPVFICREHLLAKKFFKNWAFSAVLLFNDISLQREKNKISLSINLKDQEYGIYNNAGKNFLEYKFLDNENQYNKIKEKNLEINNFMNGKLDYLTIDLCDTPLRWASGGVLPIIKKDNKYWFLFSFRGISPVGWNLANGASESTEEYINLHHLTLREFCEEIIVLNREPRLDDSTPIKQKVFQLSSPFIPKEVKSKIGSMSFIQKHNLLRQEHDNIHIIYDNKGPVLNSVETPFTINLSINDKIITQENIIFSINPFEFGIEVIALYEFAMQKNDYPLFGEIWEVADCLLREPTILVSCDYIYELYSKNNSLGEIITEKPYMECKSINIPKNEFKIYDKDIDFRNARIEKLKKLSEKSALNKKQILEIDLHKKWLDNYEKYFLDLRKDINLTYEKHKPLTMLCPVTWKTIELICKHQILESKFK